MNWPTSLASLLVIVDQAASLPFLALSPPPGGQMSKESHDIRSVLRVYYNGLPVH